MSSVNKVILVGYLGADPELRFTPKGTPVANFSIATTARFTDSDGEKQERTEWHRVLAWKRLAEIVKEYLKKGKQVYIEGRLQTRKWQDQSGNDRYTTEIVANNLVMLGRAGDVSSEPPSTGSPPAEEPVTVGTPGGDDDDLPF